MTKVYRFLLVLMLVILIISGLNICNQGMNSLTLENRQPVLALLARDDEVKIFTLGQTHTYSKQEMSTDMAVARQQLEKSRHAVSNYLQRIESVVKSHLNT